MYIQTQKGNLPAEYEWTQQEVEKGENMWWLINNTPNFTSATLKIKHADTSLWLPEAKVNYMPGNFYNAVYIVWSSLSCVSYFVKAKLWLCTFKHKKATYQLSMSEPSSHSAGSGKRRKHVMTNKQHTKFHISCIKDHACRHKSMAARG